MIMKKTWTRPVVAEKQTGMEVTASPPGRPGRKSRDTGVDRRIG
jgi:coenzyme PQQ precursor peptide PqqA